MLMVTLGLSHILAALSLESSLKSVEPPGDGCHHGRIVLPPKYSVEGLCRSFGGSMLTYFVSVAFLLGYLKSAGPPHK
jgi:hypothetical protein